MDGPIVEFQIAIAETDIDKFIGTFMIMVKTSFHNACWGYMLLQPCIVLVVQCLLRNNMTLESGKRHTIEMETASDSLYDVRG